MWQNRLELIGWFCRQTIRGKQGFRLGGGQGEEMPHPPIIWKKILYNPIPFDYPDLDPSCPPIKC